MGCLIGSRGPVAPSRTLTAQVSAEQYYGMETWWYVLLLLKLNFSIVIHCYWYYFWRKILYLPLFGQSCVYTVKCDAIMVEKWGGRSIVIYL
jgi:hypothetical protein